MRDPIEGYILGRIFELTQDGAEVIPLDSKFPRRTCGFSDIHTAEDGDREFDDNCKLRKNFIC